MQSDAIQTLSELPVGSDCVVDDIDSAPEICQRLREIGFSKDTVVRTVVKNSSRLICEVRNTRIGLHRRVAQKILIRTRPTTAR